MKISAATMEQKVRFVRQTLKRLRREGLTLADLQRRLKVRFGHRMAHRTLREVVTNFWDRQMASRGLL